MRLVVDAHVRVADPFLWSPHLPNRIVFTSESLDERMHREADGKWQMRHDDLQ